MGGQKKTPNWGNTENGVVGNGKRYAEQVLWFPLRRAHNNEVAAAPLLHFCAVKGSKDPRTVPRKDHEEGLSGLQTVLVPITDGQSPGVSREKEEMRFYLSAEASPELVTALSRAWKTPVGLQRDKRENKLGPVPDLSACKEGSDQSNSVMLSGPVAAMQGVATHPHCRHGGVKPSPGRGSSWLGECQPACRVHPPWSAVLSPVTQHPCAIPPWPRHAAR